MQDLSLHILDVAENSINADATLIEISINEDLQKDTLELVIIDNGRGIAKDIVDKVTDPFYTTRTTRKVGMGLPLLAQAAQLCDGQLSVDSKEGKGTKIISTFKRSHLDMKPLGNLTQTLITLIGGHPGIDFIYKHRKEKDDFEMDTREIKKSWMIFPSILLKFSIFLKRN